MSLAKVKMLLDSLSPGDCWQADDENLIRELVARCERLEAALTRITRYQTIPRVVEQIARAALREDVQ